MIGVIGCAQSMTVILILLQPFCCTKAVQRLYLFAVYEIMICMLNNYLSLNNLRVTHYECLALVYV